MTDLIREKGRITFAEYMDTALYHPKEGYYHSPGEIIGKAGDYYTSPHVHPVFGHLMSRLIHQMWNSLENRSDFTIVEAGAGKGFLCCDILDYAREQFPDFYDSLTYNLIEGSEYFSTMQMELLKKRSHDHKARWYSPDDFGKGIFRFDGCYLSNELLDAFPFHIVRMEGGRLKEVYVVVNEDAFTEEVGELSTHALAQYFSALNIRLQEGQRAEVNLNVSGWLQEVNIAMGRGFIITIDYGYGADELFAPFRKNGTLSCYYRHTINHNPYTRLGFQDITAHADFTNVMRLGDNMGLNISCYLEQYRFLIGLGLLEMMEELEKNIYNMSRVEYYREKLAMKNLLVPGGMGTTFKVLIQNKEIDDRRIRNLFTNEVTVHGGRGSGVGKTF